MVSFNIESLFIKNECWDYEKEWRVAKNLKEDSGDKDCIGLFGVDVRCIEEVVIGAMASEEVKGAAKKFCAKEGIPIRCSRMHEEEFRLIIE